MTNVPTKFTDRSGDAAALRRLEALVTCLSDEQLVQPLDDGWTISSILGHLAFWDRRAAFLVQLWQSGQRVPSAADGALDNATPELLQQIIAAGPSISLARADHRNEHLDQIDEALGR